jgi:hypothetical protein
MPSGSSRHISMVYLSGLAFQDQYYAKEYSVVTRQSSPL